MTAITNESNSMLNEVMASMRMDNISLVARNDKKSWNGAHREAWNKKHSRYPPKNERTFSFVNTTKKTDDNPNAQLFDFIKPSKFDVVIEAVKKLCNFETKDGQQDVRTPSLALKIGHLLKKCVNVVRGQALREKDKDSQEDTDSFEKLIDQEWSHRISHHSLSILSLRKYNKVDMLPIAEDLDKLRKKKP